MNDDRRVAVVGVGNLLLSDEGVGVEAIRRLQEAESPDPRVRFLDGGTLGLTLLPHLEDATHVLFLDALRIDAPTGTVRSYDEKELRNERPMVFSAHDVALPDLITLLRYRRGDALAGLGLIGVAVADLAPGAALTPAAEAAMPELLARVRDRCARWLSPPALTGGVAACA